VQEFNSILMDGRRYPTKHKSALQSPRCAFTSAQTRTNRLPIPTCVRRQLRLLGLDLGKLVRRDMTVVSAQRRDHSYDTRRRPAKNPLGQTFRDVGESAID
jgi:hypothetical protein